MNMKYKLVINYDKLNDFCIKNNFIIVTDNMLKENNIYKNIVYKTKNNFIGEKIYSDDMPLIINEIVWKKLKNINNELRKYDLAICIYDSYRPIEVQKIFYEEFYNKYGYYDEKLVANPNKYGTHNIIMNAIDIIPVTLDGTKIDMPCEFDDFSGKANIYFNDCSEKEKKNRDLLIDVALKNGLIVNEDEWWHFYDNSLKEFGMSFNYKNSLLIPKKEEEVFKLEVGDKL